MTKYIGPKTDGENVATQADKLSLSSETPDALTPDQSGAAGTATIAARSDHQHEILAAAAGTIEPDDAAAEGSSTSFARADHRHAIAAASAGTITGTNAEGTSTSFARADHNHAIEITPSWTDATLQNSWVDFDSTTYTKAGYYKDATGVVHLRGLVKNGTLNASATIFTLPVGLRPSKLHVFPAISNGAFARVDIATGGGVVPISGNNAYFCLDGISFPV